MCSVVIRRILPRIHRTHLYAARVSCDIPCDLSSHSFVAHVSHSQETFVSDAFVLEAFVSEALVLEAFVLEAFVSEAFVLKAFVPEAFVSGTFLLERHLCQRHLYLIHKSLLYQREHSVPCIYFLTASCLA